MGSRALTIGDIEKMYKVLVASTGQEDELTLCLIHTTLTIAFTCLLRIDEALNLLFDDIVPDEDSLTITLRSRKTDPFGGESFLTHNQLTSHLLSSVGHLDSKPFVLYQLPEAESFACPLRALSRWLILASPPGAYIFPGIRKGGRCSTRDGPIVSRLIAEILLYYQLLVF